MYYRRKLLLGVLEAFGGQLNNTTLQKVLFLVTRKQENKAYDFVPYKFGCFSFQANKDLSTLSTLGYLSSVTNSEKGTLWKVTSEESFIGELNRLDQSAINSVLKDFEGWSQRDIVKYTYQNFPYYAINSQIAGELLSAEELNHVKRQQRTSDSSCFFTIGYEGSSIEKYLNKLIINDVKVLCDVRKNPLSRKYGFSKQQLKNACESINISYVHIPDLGIESEKRRELNSLSDYQTLFREYEEDTLKVNQEALTYLEDLISKRKRVAITCFEKEVCMCHRGKILEYLISKPNWNVPYRNL